MSKQYKTTLKMLLAITFLTCATYVKAKEIALAFDATLAKSSSLDGMARSQMLVRNMIKVNVNQAMFLIHTKDISEKTQARVLLYDDAGQLIVNKGHKHWLLSRLDPYKYQVDILRANAELEPYLHYRQHIYFPFLYESHDVAQLAQLQTFLSRYGYQPSYVTYKAQDDYLNQLYQARISDGKVVDINRLETAYVKLIMDELTQYDNQAHVMLGYSPRQVLLLHENDLAAYFIVALVDALNERGWRVIDAEKIFSDPIANPYLVNGFSGVGYMKSITGLPDAQQTTPYTITPKEREKVHAYLREQGLDSLLPTL